MPLSKIFKYRIILTKNGEYLKTLYRTKTRKSTFKKFNKLKKENKKVLFPKKYISGRTISEVEYKMYAVKNYEEGDKMRNVKDVLGRNYTEKPLFDIWTILADCDYDIEETFFLYDNDFKNNRITIKDIVKILMVDIKKPTNKKVIVVNNKLLIYNETLFDMIVCKCIEDAQRLHHKLYNSINKNKIKNIIFMGTAEESSKHKLYQLIRERTNWNDSRIYKTTTS